MAGGGAGRTEDISIHAPRTGSDAQFAHGQTVKLHFNPRSPHGERLVADSDTKALVHISIHAPRTGSDGYCLAPDSINAQHFNPRSPHGERLAAPAACNPIGISIHAPRTGSDQIKPGTVRQNGDFNPRSPHGERLAGGCNNPRLAHDFNPRSPHGERPVEGAELDCALLFQSTLPARGAT